MTIKAVIFDLGRVIVPFDFNRGYSRLESLCGIPAAEIPGRIGPTGLVEQLECGRIQPKDFVKQLSDHLKLEASFDDFCDIWTSVFLPETLITEDLVKRIAQTHRLLLLSNTNAIHFEMIRENYPLLRHFHSFVLSYQVGAMKPSPLIYQRAIEEAGCRAEECFFTDDVEAYVQAAKKLGIDAVQFHSGSQIEAELRARGVL